MTGDTLADRIARAIRLVPDFPRPGIRIRASARSSKGDPSLFAAVIDAMAVFFRAEPPDTVMRIEAWGFIFGAPVAYLLEARLCVAAASRKALV